VLLAFEDLHWADPSLLDFIDYLLEWSAEYPIFVLALARPELAAIRPGWRPEVALEPLGDADMRAMLEGLVPGLPAELAERILAQAEGVPLYAVETVRMLLDRELLAQDGARYVVTGDVGDLAVPETLHALVAARLDGFEADERAALQLASVFGQAFSPAAVAALAGRPAALVRQTLDGLVAKQVLGYDDDPRAPERGQYRFLQALLRTIAYGTLSRRDRKAQHLAAARHLQETPEAGEVADILASHFLEAARAEPDAPDAPKIRAAARETLAEAGERARSLALGREAQRAFDQAAELAEDDATRADLLDRAGRAAWLEADVEAARERLDAAVTLYEAAGASVAAARAKLAMSDIVWQTDELDAALDLAERGYEGLAGEDADRAAAAALIGKLHLFRLDADAALTWTDQALEVAERLQRWDVLADALITRGATLAYRDRREEARALFMRGTDIALERDDPLAAWRGLNNLGWLAYLQDQLGESAAYAQRALETARARGDRVRMRESETSAAAIGADRGDWDGLEALAQSTTLNLEQLATGSDMLAPLAVIRAARGHRELLAELCAAARTGLEMDDRQARDSCTVAVAVAEAVTGAADEALARLHPMLSEPTAFRAVALVTYLETARAQGRDDLVRETVAWVRQLPPAQATPTMRALADRFAALLADDGAEAERLFTRSVELLAEVGRPFERAKALLDHGERLGGRERLEEARAIFAGLGATPWAERADRALGAAVA
jgi:tetratricopeptide (TPR) repeat protein